MKTLLYIFLGIFLLIDVLLAFKAFTPNSPQSKSSSRITVSSTIPTFQPKIINEKYLEKKLEERGFWKPLGVNLYKKSITKTTVKKLHFILTDTPQPVQIQVEKNGKNEKVILSYSQQFDSSTQVMTLYLQEDRAFGKSQSREVVYTGLMLYTIFDLTYDRPRKMTQFTSDAGKFMRDFIQNPDKMTLLQF